MSHYQTNKQKKGNMSQTMSLVLARRPDCGTRAFFSLLRAGGDVSESHNGCRVRSWRLRRHIKTSVRQRQRQRRVSTKGFVIIIISHINSPRLINDLRRGCLKTKRVHAAAAAGNDGLVWFVIYYFVEALRKTVTRGERERETENRVSYLLPPPPRGRCGCVAFLHQTPTKSSSAARQSRGFMASGPPPPHVRSQECSAGQTRKATSSKCHKIPLNK